MSGPPDNPYTLSREGIKVYPFMNIAQANKAVHTLRVSLAAVTKERDEALAIAPQVDAEALHELLLAFYDDESGGSQHLHEPEFKTAVSRALASLQVKP